MNKKKIVLVDDEEDVIVYLETALEDAGYSTFAASNVADGIDLIREVKPDLICLDVLMPEESGFSLFRELRRDPDLAGIPVIIASALSIEQDLKDVDYLKLPNGTELVEPEGYVEKPINAQKFLATVAAVLEEDHVNDD